MAINVAGYLDRRVAELPLDVVDAFALRQLQGTERMLLSGLWAIGDSLLGHLSSKTDGSIGGRVCRLAADISQSTFTTVCGAIHLIAADFQDPRDVAKVFLGPLFLVVPHLHDDDRLIPVWSL